MDRHLGDGEIDFHRSRGKDAQPMCAVGAERSTSTLALREGRKMRSIFRGGVSRTVTPPRNLLRAYAVATRRSANCRPSLKGRVGSEIALLRRHVGAGIRKRGLEGVGGVLGGGAVVGGELRAERVDARLGFLVAAGSGDRVPLVRVDQALRHAGAALV